MDLLKAKIYLDKINREFGRMSQDAENILRIDIDIMQSYVREFYDACLYEAAPTKQTAPVPEPIVRKSPPAPAPAEPSTPEVLYNVPPPPVVPQQPVIPPQPVVVLPPVVVPPPAPPVVSNPTPAPPSAPEQMFTPATPPPPAHKGHLHHAGVEGLFEQKEARELVEKLSEQPIQDLRRAIALNDRLLYTRELFANDNQSFENTITFLNNCSHLEEAKAYLIEQCVHPFGWTDKKKSETAKNFIKLARRRFK